jgi:trehalose 6-phosphate synthase
VARVLNRSSSCLTVSRTSTSARATAHSAPDGSPRGVGNAVEPLLLTHGGVWVAAGAGEGDRLAVETEDGLRVPPTDGRYRLRRVWLTDAEREGYYEKLANSALWPLCHRTSVAPSFDRVAFATYELVNRRFADAVADEARIPGPIVFAHDYHFALAPELIRRQLPRSRIATFGRIPWPTPHVSDTCPWRAALLRGLLGSTLIGFQTPVDRSDFVRCAARSRRSIDPRTPCMRTDAGRFSACIQQPSIRRQRWCRGLPPVAVCRSEVRHQLGIPDDAILGVGVDRWITAKGWKRNSWRSSASSAAAGSQRAVHVRTDSRTQS